MLKKIVTQKYQEVAAAKQIRPLADIIREIQPGNFRFRTALAATDWALIAECKLASPAKGRLCSCHSVSELAQIYEINGATALSVHSDQHFLGQLADLGKVRAVSKLPILRKDFIIDRYQIYESRAAGADCILLIAAILTDEQLQEYLVIARELGLDCLVEVHSQAELERVNQREAQIIGINNRDLNTFTTNIQTTLTLKPFCREGRLIISESGVANAQDALLLKAAGVQGILVGEGLVTAEKIGEQTQQMALKQQ
jgi:indole-3-glycerol phosphate synthase